MSKWRGESSPGAITSYRATRNANAPTPTNDGHPNSMTGGSFGQCIGL